MPENEVDNEHFILITPPQGWNALNLGEVWQDREILFFLTLRDIKARYKQTVLGASWAIIQPVFTMVIFSVIFGRLAKIPSDGIPYPVFSYAALVPWTMFATALQRSSNSLVGGAGLITKVYFSRIVLPLSNVLSALVDFFLAFTVLVVMIVYFAYLAPSSAPSLFEALASSGLGHITTTSVVHLTPTINVIWLPFFTLLAMITALGLGMWLSALNVQFRDIGYAIPFLTQAWLFITPIAYPSSLLSEPWHTLYGINPMAGVVEGFRWALLGVDTAPGPLIIVSTCMALVLLFTGTMFFRRMENVFADLV
jgi:lipopolysaccharide transport system permease protein